MRIELTRPILKFFEKFDQSFSHVFIFGNMFLRVTVQLLCRSQGRTISSLFTNCSLWKHVLSGTIWLTPYLMVWDWRVSRAGLMPFCWPSCSLLFFFNYFPFIYFSSIGWQCGTGVFGLIGCQSPSPGLALPIFLNNDNNNNQIGINCN